MSHPSEIDLALYSGGDLGFFAGLRIRGHVRACDACRHKLEGFAAARELACGVDELPDGLEWERLAQEMTANIHLGLAAGECVAPVVRPARPRTEWESWQRPAVVFAGTVLAVFLAWFAYTPVAPPPAVQQTAGVLAEATDEGIELNDNGRVLGLNRGSDEEVVSVSLQGAVRARYVDSETGQVTIHNVYVQ
jgi:hypothetical protein